MPHRLPPAGFEPDIVCRSSSPTTTLYMVQGGLGVAFLPSEDFHSHTLSGVREIKLEERIVKEVGVGLAPGRRPPPWLDAAVQFAGEWSNDRPFFSSFPPVPLVV